MSYVSYSYYGVIKDSTFRKSTDFCSNSADLRLREFTQNYCDKQKLRFYAGKIRQISKRKRKGYKFEKDANSKNHWKDRKEIWKMCCLKTPRSKCKFICILNATLLGLVRFVLIMMSLFGSQAFSDWGQFLTSFLTLKLVIVSYFLVCFTIVYDVYEEIEKIEKTKSTKNQDVETGQASNSGDVRLF